MKSRNQIVANAVVAAALSARIATNAEPRVEDAVRKALHDSLERVLKELRSVIPTVHGQTASVVVDVVPKELSSFFRELTDPKTLSMLHALVRRLA